MKNWARFQIYKFYLLNFSIKKRFATVFFLVCFHFRHFLFNYKLKSHFRRHNLFINIMLIFCVPLFQNGLLMLWKIDASGRPLQNPLYRNQLAYRISEMVVVRPPPARYDIVVCNLRLDNSEFIWHHLFNVMRSWEADDKFSHTNNCVNPYSINFCSASTLVAEVVMPASVMHSARLPRMKRATIRFRRLFTSATNPVSHFTLWTSVTWCIWHSDGWHISEFAICIRDSSEFCPSKTKVPSSALVRMVK